jgi:glycosyltransferase involved in cell wall biosynthesis
MKINFLSYLHPFRYNGGGEMALRAVIEHGRQRGHDIGVFARRTGKLSRLFPPRLESLPPADVYFLADLFNCPEEGLALDRSLLERIVARSPYIHFDNAYVDVCQRPAFPCSGDRVRCPDACTLERARWLYAGSLACVFVSPLHYRVVSGILGQGIIRNPIIARPFVDTSLFFDRHEPRDIDCLYVGMIAKYKGYENLRRLFSGQNILLIGKNITGEKLIGKHIPYVPQSELPAYYNRAKNFVHLPEWIEPQGRTVVEAALCGCNLITNENVGATSFDFDISNPQIIADAPDHLWRDIEACLGVATTRPNLAAI